MVWLQLKGEQLSGSAYYFNGCKALMFSSVAHFNQATRQLSTWVKATVSSVGGLRFWPASAIPQVLCERSTVLQRIITMKKKKKKSKLNSAVARESQIWSRPKKEGNERKMAERCQVFAGTRGRKDRCLIFFSVQEAGLGGVDVCSGSLLMFAFCQSVCAGAEKISLTLIFLQQRGA